VRVTLPNDFTPRPYQEAPMRHFDAGGKRAITIWHRRAGKDLTAMHQTCKAGHEERGQYWHFFPTGAQGRRAIWDGFTRSGARIMEQVFPGFLDCKRRGSVVKAVNATQMLVELK
jgi:phage terminase large subunit